MVDIYASLRLSVQGFQINGLPETLDPEPQTLWTLSPKC